MTPHEASSRRGLNAPPAVLTLSTGPLVLVIRQWARPALAVAPWPIPTMLGVAPNFVSALCVRFTVLMRPSLVSKARAAAVFSAGCGGTLAILLVMEWWRPLAGAATLDIGDIVASVVGAALSLLVYREWMRDRLRFGSTAGRTAPPS